MPLHRHEPICTLFRIHWPSSTLGACGEYNDQYQTPFTDGLLCNGPQDPPEPALTVEFFPANIGVQGQIFTVVNNEEYYYPNLIQGMLVNTDADIGTKVTAYTGSRTGGDFGDQPVEGDVCDNVSPGTTLFAWSSLLVYIVDLWYA